MTSVLIFALVVLAAIALLGGSYADYTKSEASQDPEGLYNTNPAYLFYVDSPNAVCNDGTPGGFYFRRGLNPEKWIFYLEDQTGYCWDEASCDYRSDTLGHLMTSNDWPAKNNASDYYGLLSPNGTKNPHMYDAYMVHIKYCSSDFFTGTAENTSYGYHFNGWSIIEAVTKHIMTEEISNLDLAKQILYAGSGPGAAGVMLTMDHFYDLFHNEGFFEEPANMTSDDHVTVLRGFMDSGWFSLHDPYTERTCDGNLGSCNWEGVFSSGINIWDPKYPKGCAEDYADEGQEWLCYFGNYSYEYVETPLYVFQYQYDYSQLDTDGAGVLHAGIDFDPDATAFAEECADQFILEEVGPYVAWGFFPACFGTTVLHTDKWDTVSVHSGSTNKTQYLSEALEDWWSLDLEARQLYADTCGSINCNPTCDA